MAFNPFQVFRKHKRTGLAAVAIMCMFLFVLSSGLGSGGDPLDRIAQWIGSRGFRAEDMAFLNGKPVTNLDLLKLQRQREMANAYMMESANRVLKNLFDQDQAAMQGKDGLDTFDAKAHGQTRQKLMLLNQYIRPFAMFGQDQQRYAYFEPPSEERPFSASKLVDFLVWKQIARKLGINLTRAAIDDEVNRMLMGGMTPQISRQVAQIIQDSPVFQGLSLEEALRDELSVRLAKAALLGETSPPMVTARPPIMVTPQEFKEFFDDYRTEIEVAFLPVRVKDYLNQVTAQPTERDLQRLYDRYKEDEYDPTRRPGLPGFKQPRRIQVQYIGGDPDSPYYRQKAQELAAVLEGLSRIGAGVPTTPLQGLLPHAVSLTVPLAVDLPLAADYFKERFPNLQRSGWSDDIRSPVRNEAAFQPGTIASVIGQAASIPLVWPAWQAQIAANEKAERIDLALSLLSSPSPFAAAAVVVHEFPQDQERLLSYAEVQDWLKARYLDGLARAALVANLDRVRKQVDELRTTKKLAEVDKLVAGLAANYHLQTGKSGLRDRYKDPIGDDPALKTLRDIYIRLSGGDRADLFGWSDDPQLKAFSETLYGQPDRPSRPYEVQTWGGRGEIGQGNWQKAPHLYLIWKTEEQPARVVPLTDPAVRQEVEKAWRWQEARKLAQKAAEELAKEAAPLKGDLPKLRDFALRHKEELIERDLPRLAKRIKQEELRPEFPLRYVSPTIPESRLGEIGFAGNQMFNVPADQAYTRFMDRVLSLKDQEIGSAVAVTNRPQTDYYVAILLKKIPPTEDEFLRAYKEATGTGARQGQLFDEFLRTRGGKFYDEFMKALREEVKLEVNQNRLDDFDGNRGGEF